MSDASQMTPLEWLGFEELACRVLHVHSKRGVGRLLRAFVEHPGQVLTLSRLSALSSKFGFVGVHPMSAKSYISWLRDALQDLGLDDAVECVRGQGYRMSGQHAERIKALILAELR